MKQAIFKAPKGLYCGEEELKVLRKAYKEKGGMISVLEVKALFPEQFAKDKK